MGRTKHLVRINKALSKAEKGSPNFASLALGGVRQRFAPNSLLAPRGAGIATLY